MSMNQLRAHVGMHIKAVWAHLVTSCLMRSITSGSSGWVSEKSRTSAPKIDPGRSSALYV